MGVKKGRSMKDFKEKRSKKQDSSSEEEEDDEELTSVLMKEWKRIKKEKNKKKNRKPSRDGDVVGRKVPIAPVTVEQIHDLDHQKQLTVTKGPVETHFMVAEAPPSTSVAPVAAKPADAKPADDKETESFTVVTANEVLKAAGDTKCENSVKKRDKSQGGDFGAAYGELYSQLCTRMLYVMHDYFKRVYAECNCSESRFKRKLENIPLWDQKQITRRTAELVRAHKNVEMFFRYAYAANLMLMSLVIQKDEEAMEDVEIEVPKFSTFVHGVYIECARVLYDNSSVLDASLPHWKQLKIRMELFKCYGNAIATALRMMVPLNEIVKAENIETYEDLDSSSSSSDDDEDSSCSSSSDDDEDSSCSSSSDDDDEDDDDDDEEDDEDEDDEDEDEDEDDDDDDEDEDDDDDDEDEDDEDEDDEDGGDRKQKRKSAKN
jgi:hypothetical protein